VNVLKQRPSPTTERRIDAPSDHAEGLAFHIWKSLERRLSKLGSFEHRPVAIRPRSEEDVAHFELMWEATGRDVYRFSVW
jgi:hypothetical protein